MTAVMDAVATAAAAVPRLYATGSVPAGPQTPYSSYSALLGRGDTHLLDASEGIRWGRIVVQSFDAIADGALDHAEKVRAALVGARLVIDGQSCTPVQAELDPAVTHDPDGNSVVGVTATYTFTKEQP